MRKVSREVGGEKEEVGAGWGRGGAGGAIKVRRQESLEGTRVQGRTKEERGEGDQFRREM